MMMRRGLALSTLSLAVATTACLPDEEPELLDATEQAATSPERVVRVALGGHADLALQFSEFFGGAFTLSAWFQPEFVRAYQGPILAENGGGRFTVGMDEPSSGDPVLFLRVGNKTVRYVVPTLEPRTWHHLAVVRSNFAFPSGANTFSLYLDGQKLTPTTSEIGFSSSDPMSLVPTGNLRVGRRTDTLGGERYWQYYGLVDEVAVYRGHPLIATLAAKREVVESDTLIKGFTFDTILYANPKLKHGVTYVAPTEALNLPMFGSVFDLESKVSPTAVEYTLPFERGQAWRVGYEFGENSHTGTSAFCWDFYRVGASTQNTPIVAAAPGDVIRVHDSEDDEGYVIPSDWTNQPWSTQSQTAANEMTSHRHLHAESVEDALCDGECDPLPQENGVVIRTTRGQTLGIVGTSRDPSNSHLHFGLKRVEGAARPTIPMAFADYQLCELAAGETVTTTSDLSKCSWRDVGRGMPRKGEIIRNPL